MTNEVTQSLDSISIIDIFIAADEIELFEVNRLAKKRLLEFESAWKFPKDFITICKHDVFTDLYKIALELVCRNPRVIFESNEGSSNVLSKRESAYSFDSKIISAKDAALISNWIDNKQERHYHFKDIPFKFDLIYRASLENFSINKFHSKCDNKGPTVIIIKVRNSGEIIGGYNPLSWRSTKLMKSGNLPSNVYNDYKCETSKSFIFSLFSLSNGAIPRLSRVFSKKEAIIWSIDKGPCFGLQDLWILYNHSQHVTVGRCKQHTYNVGIIDKDTFEIEEYEIFQITDKRFLLKILNSIVKRCGICELFTFPFFILTLFGIFHFSSVLLPTIFAFVNVDIRVKFLATLPSIIIISLYAILSAYLIYIGHLCLILPEIFMLSFLASATFELISGTALVKILLVILNDLNLVV
ncbi:389_t:CDS:2 [Cetraspora pellucida]|uniref:389_t:CDS:1 n=1 Tax=Cetraspora pellucida TaxID=1433469 RepID=A0A9N8WQ34_9GLOM|nr:389_t:CDS:2 [Cetraspora pellucida]